MTEAEWLVSDNPEAMLHALEPRASSGKLSLKLTRWLKTCFAKANRNIEWNIGDHSKLVLRWARSNEWDSACPLAYRAAVLRDVIGNPFRPIKFDRDWLSRDVLWVMNGPYEFPLDDGSIDNMHLRVMADALMDAGCDSEDILSHLRSPGPHVRGCHVIDLILGRE